MHRMATRVMLPLVASLPHEPRHGQVWVSVGAW